MKPRRKSAHIVSDLALLVQQREDRLAHLERENARLKKRINKLVGRLRASCQLGAH